MRLNVDTHKIKKKKNLNWLNQNPNDHIIAAAKQGDKPPHHLLFNITRFTRESHAH